MAYAGFCQRGSLQSLFRGAGITPEIFFQINCVEIAVEEIPCRLLRKYSTRRLISRIILASVVNASSRRCRGLLYLFHISVLYCDSIRCNCSTLNIIGQLQTNNVKYMYDIMTARGSAWAYNSRLASDKTIFKSATVTRITNISTVCQQDASDI